MKNQNLKQKFNPIDSIHHSISQEKKNKNSFKTFAKSFVLSIFFFGILGAGFIFFSLNELNAAIFENNFQETKNQLSFKALSNTFAQLTGLTSRTEIKQDEQGWTNILLLGLPDKRFPGQKLTDSILIGSLNEKNKKLILTSIPRDLAISYDEQNPQKLTKINSFYAKKGGGAQGTLALSEKLKQITDLEIHYYTRLDFTGFEKLIDALNGIDVQVMEDIYDPKYPTPNYGTEIFEIKKGIHHLNGATALKYVRTRHTSENDFGRSKRQQQVIQIVLNKLKTKKNLLDFQFNSELFNLIKDHIKTNFSFIEIKRFYELGQKIDLNNTKTIVIDNRSSGLLESRQGKILGYYLQPKDKSFKQIQEYISNEKK